MVSRRKQTLSDPVEVLQACRVGFWVELTAAARHPPGQRVLHTTRLLRPAHQKRRPPVALHFWGYTVSCSGWRLRRCYLQLRSQAKETRCRASRYVAGNQSSLPSQCTMSAIQRPKLTFSPARDAPAVDRPANAPVGPGLDVELGVIYRSPTRPDEGPDDAAQVQQGLDGPNEPAVVLREDLGFDAVGHGDTAGDAPVRSDMAVAGGGA